MIDESANSAAALPAASKRRLPWFRLAIWAVSIVAVFAILGFFVAPPLVRAKLSSELTKLLHRQVTIGEIRINPFQLSLTARGFLVKERDGSATAVSFDELYTNLEIQSLFRWGLVLKELRLVKPYISLVRNQDRTYNVTDLIDEFSKGPPGPTPRFALNNIQIVEGRIDFDDRPEQTKHTITAIKLDIPFISSIPSQVDIKVQPALHAVVNGAPFQFDGETKPFKDSRESTLHINIEKLQIPKYFEYSPVELNFKIASGELTSKLAILFKASKDNPSALSVSGNIGIRDLKLQEKNELPLFDLSAFDVGIENFDVLAKKLRFKSIEARGPELHVISNRDGSLNLTSLIASPQAAKPPEPKADEKPFVYAIDNFVLDQGKLFFTDRGPERPYEKRLENIHVDVKGFTNENQKQAAVEVSFQAPANEQFNYSGTLQLTPFLAEGDITIKDLQLKGLRPYYEGVVGLEIAEGLLDLNGHFTEQSTGKGSETKLSKLDVALRSLRLDLPGEGEPLWRTPFMTIKDATVDVEKKSIVIGSFETRDGSGSINRDADGTINYTRLIKTKAAPSDANKPAQEDTAEWAVEVKRSAFDRFRITFEDRALNPPAHLSVSNLTLRGENHSNAKNARAKVMMQAAVNNKGRLRMEGVLGLRPVGGRLNVQAQDIEVMPFQPYFAEQVNFLLTGGKLSSKGILNVETGGDGETKVNYEGGIQASDFASVDKSASQDLLKWSSLDLAGVQFALQPMQMRINEITLADFYARAILGSDGKLNLQNLAASNGDKNTPPTKGDSTNKAAAAADTPSAGEKPITIGKINLKGGQINFSDFFIKPNYNANLMSVQGTISELKPDQAGDLAVVAKLDNAAPVDIHGKINPLAKSLFLDIVADASEIELQPFSPYSGKYVGYGIEKGKLSFNVKYKVENRKLDAQNRITLNQLTFGEKIESPDATKLPVLLAVALLKDRNGVIDVNLPIGGSLDDPKFSVGGIILQIVFNIIIKAVSSPFALLGAAFGGGGEELSYIEFDYGVATIPQSGDAKIKSLVTAMNDRPGLKLEIAGRVDPVADLDGIQKVSIERKLKAQKMKDLVREGSAPSSVDEVQIGKDEYEKYLKAAYRDENFPKPRNLIGLARDLPAPEMEALMLKNLKISDEDLRDLGNRRALAVRDRLLASGPITADRLFIVAPKPLTDAEKDKLKLKASRVDFSLR